MFILSVVNKHTKNLAGVEWVLGNLRVLIVAIMANAVITYYFIIDAHWNVISVNVTFLVYAFMIRKVAKGTCQSSSFAIEIAAIVPSATAVVICLYFLLITSPTA